MRKKKSAKHIAAFVIMIAATVGLYALIVAAAIVTLESIAPFPEGDYTNADSRQKTAVLRSVGRTLGVDVSDGELYYGYDNHGGFHGDGETYIEIRLPEDAQERFENASSWQSLPVSDNVRINYFAVNLINHEREDYEELIPVPENCYCYFRNRSMEQRDYMNYTIAVYNADTRVLYFCIMDI